MKKFVCVIITVLLSIQIYSQEALKSIEEEYFDFLSLQGLIDRPTLGYRTLSDSVWNINEDVQHIWKNNNLGKSHILFKSENQGKNWFSKGFFHGLKLKLFGPEWFNSYNTAAPYGQNDGALWQGRGYNTSFTTGVRLEGYGFEATFKPQLSFSQNLDFEIMPSNYDSEFGYFWGYGKNIGIDAPQRFGDKSFFTFDWGDSEIRYSWKTLTIGFGTQSIWLGPAQINPILHSNNAPTYPKIDIGLRKTEINIPWWDLYLGDLEFRCWAGKLSESDYFDNDESNNNNLISAFSFSYLSPFLDGLNITFNKICISKWEKESLKYINPFYYKNNYKHGVSGEDQKISIGYNWQIPKGRVNVYGELAIDDRANNKTTFESIATHYWHTSAYLWGIKKQIVINNYILDINFEWYNSEMSQDMQVQWYYSFGFHNLIQQGYTNSGQYLGSGSGYGGQGQFLKIKLLYPKGFSSLYFYRNQPDNDYLFKESIYDKANPNLGDQSDLHKRTWNCYKTYFSIGFESVFYKKNFVFQYGIIYTLIINPLYKSEPRYEKWNNFTFLLSVKYNLF